jgi:uncharacterized protein YjaZ
MKHFIDEENEVNFDSMSKNVRSISSANLDSLFTSIATKMNNLTGYKIRGKWYICMLGNNMCDLCGNGQIMLIDLLNNKVNYEHIRLSLPHEFNHQILIAAKSSDTLAMSGFGAFMNEGMAEYIKYIFWEKFYSPQQVLGYSDNEYRWCIENEDKIKNDAQKLYLSRNWEEIKKYLLADSKVYDDGPSRLGYFVGFRICQKYVSKYGKDAWKDFYKLPFIEIINRL